MGHIVRQGEGFCPYTENREQIAGNFRRFLQEGLHLGDKLVTMRGQVFQEV
jgi:hypothetical protein